VNEARYTNRPTPIIDHGKPAAARSQPGSSPATRPLEADAQAVIDYE
jgi:hypothetical protein